jgi:hypothetical protein
MKPKIIFGSPLEKMDDGMEKSHFMVYKIWIIIASIITVK